MKSIGFLVATGILALATEASAQDKRFEIGAFGGYMFGGTAEGKAESLGEPLTSRAEIGDAASYGAVADVAIRSGSWVELSYTRQATTLSLRQSSVEETTTTNYDLLVQYAHIGGLLEFQSGSLEWFRPIFGGTIGATIYSANDKGFDYEEWRLSLAFEGGAKIRLTNFLGLRFQGRVLATFLADDSAMFCASGAGCAFAYTGTAVVQGEVTGGAYLAF